MTPKVFVSHASEDKERFVLDFATKLRANGVDVWLDKWEMSPGDSLIEKIFEEGIKDAQAVIVVISAHSISKPWVKQELDAACVKRINNGSRLIPVVIDECEVPEALKSTLWETIRDTNSYKDNLDRILASIFGKRDKPPLGQPPAHLTNHIETIAGHTQQDSLIYKLSCEYALANNSYAIPITAFVVDNEYVIPEAQLKESIQALGERGIFYVKHPLANDFPFIKITESGFELYCRKTLTNYQAARQQVISAIVNEGCTRLSQINEKLSLNPFLIENIVRGLDSGGQLTANWNLDNDCTISDITVTLRRSLS